ncbi:MAG: molybdate ABC transporter substrate-binding protein [Gammaproteobacteria bacterium]|nr:molybdate ABC transporter substrate-binding protein [Gammaproteobacteria bacterium]
MLSFKKVRKRHPPLRVFFCLLLLLSNNLQADELIIAVASNFSHALKLLSDDFHTRTGHELRISSASTGKLYAQIQHGAPFDLFLAADEKRPDLLVADDKAEESSAYVYARGRLVFLSNIKPVGNCQQVLVSPALKRLAIANPKTAPYGVAAKQVIEGLGLWSELEPRLVKGENIAQTMQFVSTKNAQAGFVARSMLHMGKDVGSACTWDVPEYMHSPVNQKLVLLNKAKGKVAAQEFFSYMKSTQAKKIIKAAGYDVLE